jgi:hypothetical protein
MSKSQKPTTYCCGCGEPVTAFRGGAPPKSGAARRGVICAACAVCKCGSGKPPGLCHRIAKSGRTVSPPVRYA